VFKGSGFYATDNRSPSGMESRTTEDHTGDDSKSKSPEKKTDKTKEKTK
jgi:predicted nucleic acid-binding Zn ribbon protein